jgi:hypothetical protein
MERRSFIGLLAGVFASIFAAPTLFDFGKPRGYQTYIVGKNAVVSDNFTRSKQAPLGVDWQPSTRYQPGQIIDVDDPSDWHPAMESVYYDKQLIENLKDSTPLTNWKSYQTHHTVELPKSSGLKRSFFQYRETK